MIKNFLLWIRCYFSYQEIYNMLYKIQKWHKKNFPKTTYKEQLNKVTEEIREYNIELDGYIHSRNRQKKNYCARRIDEELTDIIIASINCMRYPEIREKVKVKMAINEHRTFKNNHHI